MKNRKQVLDKMKIFVSLSWKVWMNFFSGIYFEDCFQFVKFFSLIY